MRRHATRAPATLARRESGRSSSTADQHKAIVHGTNVWLTCRELELLELLVAHPRRVLGRDEIHEAIWGPRRARFTPTARVEAYISRLRRKLAAASPGWIFIHTHHNVGYRLDPEPRGGLP